MVERDSIRRAFAFSFVHLYLKLDESMPSLRVSVREKGDTVEIRCPVPAQNGHSAVSFSATGEQVYAANGAELRTETVGNALHYVVSLPSYSV
jgi:hypothetical protein